MQKLFAETVPPVRLTFDDPAVAVTVPLHVLLTFGDDATTIPVGKASATAMPVSGMPFEFVIFSVSVVFPFRGIVAAPNVLSSTGGDTTVRFADDEFPVPPSVEVIGPAVFT